MGQGSVETYHSETLFMLWQAMRHHNAAIVSDQKACLARYEDIQNELISTLNDGAHYPWTLLARLEPPKFSSDIIESIIAAIWIDSCGSMAACSAFLERLGLIPYLEKVLSRDTLALLHPKEELGKSHAEANPSTIKCSYARLVVVDSKVQADAHRDRPTRRPRQSNLHNRSR